MCRTIIYNLNFYKMRKRERQKRLGQGMYNWIELCKTRKREIIYNLNLYKTRKRERQKRLDKEYAIESNCIKREREKLDTIWKLYKTRKRERQKKLGMGVFLLYNYKCIGRKYMYLHVYIQFSHALYKQKRNLYISLLFV